MIFNIIEIVFFFSLNYCQSDFFCEAMMIHFDVNDIMGFNVHG